MKTKSVTILLFITIATIRLVGQVNLNQGLVAYFPFSGNANDVSGNNNNATVNGASLTSDKWGNPNSAYYFNGTSDYMYVSSPSNMQMNSITICAFVKPFSFYNGLCYNNSIIDRGNGGYNSGSFSLIYTPSLNQNPSTYCYIPDSIHENYRITVGWGASNSLNCITPANGVPYILSNQWDCVIGTFDSASKIGTVYVNGILRYSYTLNTGMGTTNSSPLFIGGTSSIAYPYFVHGVLDEIRIYNRVINSQERDSICNQILTTMVISNYQFEQTDSCNNLQIQFTDSSYAFNTTIQSWNWDFGDGTTSNLQNPLHVYSSSGTYNVTLIVSNGQGNNDTMSQQLSIIPSAQMSLSIQSSPNPPILCQGESCTLFASGLSSYQWSNNITNGLSFNPTNSSWYTVTGTDSNGCIGIDSIFVQVNSLPLIQALANPNPVCYGDQLILSANGASQYVWSSNVQNNVPFTPSATTTYTVIGTDINGCQGWDSITVPILPAPQLTITPTDTIICYGDSVFITAQGATTYTWNPPSNWMQIDNSSISVFPSTSTNFIVTGTDALGCSATIQSYIEVKPPLDIQITKDRDANCTNRNVTLQASGAQSYAWQPENSSNQNDQVAHYTFNETTQVTVTGWQDGCAGSDSLWVMYYPTVESALRIPNAFTPNGDGLNDCFRILYHGEVLKFYLAIYNRWGQRVFETDNYQSCWNGDYNNKRVELGIYFFMLEINTPCGLSRQYGDVNIIY